MYYETVDYRVDDFRYTVYIKAIPGYELADDGMDFDLDTRDPISVEECFERYGTLTLQDSETIGNYSSNACFITIFIIDKSKDEIFEHYNNKIDFFEFGFDTQNKNGLGVFGTIGYISENSSSFTVYSCLDENSVIVYGFDFSGIS